MVKGRLICRRCGGGLNPAAPRWRCECGGHLDLAFSPRPRREDFKGVSGTLWRYLPALPLSDEVEPVTLGEGGTPLVTMTAPGGARCLVKMDHLQPTGSFKDRGASVMISRLKHLGIREVVEDSSGNAGAAVAAYCARAAMKCTIYVPASAPRAKLAQISAYGAQVVKVEGPREAAAEAVLRAADNVYYAGHCVDPFFIQGTKTLAYELVEQLGWRAPRTVAGPLGNGTLILGLIQGFTELLEAGLISCMPRILAFQSRACNPLARAYREGKPEPVKIEPTASLADGIAAAAPLLGRRILEEVRRVGAEILDVKEDAIRNAWRRWAVLGLSVEPTAAVALAGMEEIGEQPGETVVVVTGHGLKRLDQPVSSSTVDVRR